GIAHRLQNFSHLYSMQNSFVRPALHYQDRFQEVRHQTLMPQIIMDEVATPKQYSSDFNNDYENLFVEGGNYVFDGNRVIARFRIGRNGVGRWRLETIDPSLSLVVTPDLRVRKYRRTKPVRIIRAFDAVFDALKPLDEALCICAQRVHAWSPLQFGAG